jgi:hypothetical protein
MAWPDCWDTLRRDLVDALTRLAASQGRPMRPIQIGETSVSEAVSSEAHVDEKIGVRALNATPYDRRNWLVSCAAVGSAAVLLTLQLLVPPIVGLANEGDFERVMGYAGLNYRTEGYQEKYYGHITTKFAIVLPGWYRSGYITSEIPLAILACETSKVFLPGQLFDIRMLGAIHVLLLLFAIGLLVRSCRSLAPASQWLVAVLLVLVFTDVGYAAAFNSFYPQTASLLFLLLTIAFASLGIQEDEPSGPILVAFFLCAALFVCSKPQECIQGPLLAVWGARLGGVRTLRSWRRPSFWLALALCAVSLWYYRNIPRTDIRYVGVFHSVFRELLPNSPDPARDLEELRLDRDLLKYSGMSAYMANSPVWDAKFQARVFDHLGYRALVSFYLRHPARLLDRLRRGAPAAFRLRPDYLGNFERATGVRPRTKTSHFAVWSDLRARIEPRSLLWLSIVLAGNLAAVAMSYRGASTRGRQYLTALTFLLLIAGAELLVNALADCLDDLGRHLYAFDALFDLILIADLAWLTHMVVTYYQGIGLKKASAHSH